MAKATQENRLLLVNTPLGKDYLLIENIEVEEKVSELFEIKVRLLFDEEEDDQFQLTPIKINQILGQTVTVALNQPDGNKRFFAGMINQLLQIGRNRRFSFYEATIVPHVWKLTQSFQSRIFQQKSTPEILKEVFSGFEVKYQLQADYKPRNYCVQYQENDWNFVSRLMEEEGIYYYFEHSAETLKLVLRDTFSNPENCPNKHELPIYNEDLDPDEDWESAVKSIQMNYTLQTGKVTVWDYNFQLPKKTLDSEKKSQYNIGNNQELEVYTFPTGYARKYDGIDKSGGEQASALNDVFPDSKRTVENKLAALDSQHKVLKGVSDCCSLTPGYRFQLKNHPNKELNTQYIVLSVTHNANQIPSYTAADKEVPRYENEFTCIPHGSGQPEFRPSMKAPKPLMTGSQTAFVVGPAGEEIFTDKYGRVKVQFHWDRSRRFDASSSCWVRVAQSWAGNKWGTMFLPRIGMEVVVSFLEGDPDQPIITGCVYNPEAMPPYTLPDEKTKTTIKTNSSKGGGGFNELRFEDKKGSEQIFIHGEKDLDVRIKNDRKEIIKNNSHLIVEKDQFEQVKGDKHLTVAGDQNEKVGGSVSLKVDGGIQDKAGTKFTVDAGQEIHLKSGMSLTLETGTNLTLKVGGNFININPGGIFIKGTMVMLNSGGAAGSGSGSSPTPPTVPKEAVTANPGDKIPTAPPQAPPKPKTFSQQALSMQSAAENGTPFCEVCNC